jgi:hypothetical protein
MRMRAVRLGGILRRALDADRLDPSLGETGVVDSAI